MTKFLKTRVAKAFALLICIMLIIMPVASACTYDESSSKTEELAGMFTTADLMDITITELAEALDSGLTTSAEVTQMYLDRIGEYDDMYNATIAVNSDALKLAKECDAEREAGESKGVLHGVPVVIKDNYDYVGMATTAGAKALENNMPKDNSYAVQQLVDAGAIIISKANMSEFAWSGVNSRSSMAGTCLNTYDLERTPAGSSGGTGVSISANFGVAGLGSDTGSSIRRPASFNNLFGLRPSKGLTSIDGIVPLSADQDVAGPLTRSASDLAIMMDAIAGTDEADHYTVEADADQYIPEGGFVSGLKENALEGKRIGYLTNSFGEYTSTTSNRETGEYVTTVYDEPVLPEERIQTLVENTLDVFEGAGAEFIDLSEILTEETIFSLKGAGSSIGNSTTGKVFEWDMWEYFQANDADEDMNSVADIKTTEYGVDYITDLSSYTTAEEDYASPYYNEDGTKTEAYESLWTARVDMRTTISEILEENNIDAVIYEDADDVAQLETLGYSQSNGASYISTFGPRAGLPDMNIPMGLTEPDSDVVTPMPCGISLFSSFGNDATLIEIAYGYEQAAEDYRVMTTLAPTLEDDALTTFANSMIEDIDALDADSMNATYYSVLQSNYDAYLADDKTDGIVTYDIVSDLALSYDLATVSAALSDAGADTAAAAAGVVVLAICGVFAITLVVVGKCSKK